MSRLPLGPLRFNLIDVWGFGVPYGVLGYPIGCWSALWGEPWGVGVSCGVSALWGKLWGVGVPYEVSHGVSGCPMGCWGALLGVGVPYGVSHGVLGYPMG